MDWLTRLPPVTFPLTLGVILILGSFALLVAHKMSKEKFSASVGIFKSKNTEITLLKVEAKSTSQEKSSSQLEQEIAQELKAPELSVHYQQVVIPQGLIILGLFKQGNSVRASLKAMINIPFDKETDIILFVDQSDGHPRSGRTYSIDDSVSVGLSDNKETSRIIFGPVPLRSLLSS